MASAGALWQRYVRETGCPSADRRSDRPPRHIVLVQAYSFWRVRAPRLERVRPGQVRESTSVLGAVGRRSGALVTFGGGSSLGSG